MRSMTQYDSPVIIILSEQCQGVGSELEGNLYICVMSQLKFVKHHHTPTSDKKVIMVHCHSEERDRERVRESSISRRRKKYSGLNWYDIS